MTIADCIERALKKGGDNEKAAAANLASLLCIQLGSIDYAEDSYQDLLSTLMFVVNDESVPLLAREKVSVFQQILIILLYTLNFSTNLNLNLILVSFYFLSAVWP